jgi:phosphoribosylformylglycinamidine cyclo-ligase
VVDKANILGAYRVQQGDVLIGIASSGLHSNGYSLVRAVVSDLGWSYDRDVPEFGRALGEELLTPTHLYTRPCLVLADTLGNDLHALSHVTGGGLAANLARVLPANLGGVVSRASWVVPPVFHLLHDAGRVPWADLEHTVNLGVGMVAVVAYSALGQALETLAQQGEQAVPIGRVGTIADLEEEAKTVGSAQGDLVSGAKGADGGAVLLTDAYHAA